MTSFSLKIIAIVAMFCDHFGDAFFGQFSFLNLIGRMAFPIFAFQISEGYTHTKNLRKYFIRLGIFAIISQIPFSLFSYKILNATTFSLNVFFTLFIGLLSIYLYDYICTLSQKSKNDKPFIHYIDKIFALFIVVLLSYVAELIHTDYGYWGVIIIFAFYLLRKRKIAMLSIFVALCFIKYLPDLIKYNFNYLIVLLFLFTALPALFIGLYNGKQGKKIKYLLYAFYPLHLFLLYLIFN